MYFYDYRQHQPHAFVNKLNYYYPKMLSLLKLGLSEYAEKTRF